MFVNGRTLVCEDGKVLFNGSIIVKEVSLGDWDSPLNWNEITEEEADKIQKELEGIDDVE